MNSILIFDITETTIDLLSKKCPELLILKTEKSYIGNILVIEGRVVGFVQVNSVTGQVSSFYINDGSLIKNLRQKIEFITSLLCTYGTPLSVISDISTLLLNENIELCIPSMDIPYFKGL